MNKTKLVTKEYFGVSYSHETYKKWTKKERISPYITFWDAIWEVYAYGNKIEFFNRMKQYVNNQGETVIITQEHRACSGLSITISVFGDCDIPKYRKQHHYNRDQIIDIAGKIHGCDMSNLKDNKEW